MPPILDLSLDISQVHVLLSPLGEGKKERTERGKRKYISLLLTSELLSEFCWSSWMPQEKGGWASFFSLPMALQGWGPGLGCNFAVNQPPAQVLSELPGPHCPSAQGLLLYFNSRADVHVVNLLLALLEPTVARAHYWASSTSQPLGTQHHSASR